MTSCEQAIREHAYAIWEEEGRPDERALDNWLQAETEKRAMSTPAPTGYENVLSISYKEKGIPYGGFGEPRPDGGANYGFKNLKGDSSLKASVPELQKDAPLKGIICAINRRDTGLFSIGCDTRYFRDERTYTRQAGYIEFAFNSRIRVADAQHYFFAFFHFDRLLFSKGFKEPVRFSWQIKPAMFTNVNLWGFSCAIDITTWLLPSLGEARRCWATSLSQLGEYLSSIPAQADEPPIY